MPLNPALKNLIEQKLASAPVPQWEMPIEQVREAFAKLWTPAITGGPVELRNVEDRALPTKVGPVNTRVYVPDERKNPSMVMYFHGGGYVKGGVQEANAFCRRLAKSTGRIVASVGYRLAPEHPFPAALDDAYAATSWAFEHAEELGATRASFAVCGESAGGNLAAVVCLLAKSRQEMMISNQILLQPVTDFTLSKPSINMPETECLVPRDDLAWYYREYCGTDRDFRDPRLSPLWAADVSGLPRTLIIAAEYDTLRDEAAAYAGKLRSAGVDVTYSFYAGMVHGFLGMGGLVKEAQEAIDEIARFLGRDQALSPDPAAMTSGTSACCQPGPCRTASGRFPRPPRPRTGRAIKPYSFSFAVVAEQGGGS
jgi:acetyl esterase